MAADFPKMANSPAPRTAPALSTATEFAYAHALGLACVGLIVLLGAVVLAVLALRRARRRGG